MGIVWEARDELLDRPVAVKELRSLPGLSVAEAGLAGQRAMREARLTARLVHPYAVTVFDVVEHDDQPCLVLQFVPSESLSALLRSLGRLSPEETARVGCEVGSALAAAHQLGIVHGDVKPGNVLIGDDGAARICDFGIADALGEATSGAAGLMHGTPAYLTPEVARGGEPGFASDVFALGATLFAAVEGAPPFGTDENPVRLVHRIATDLPAPPRQAGALTSLLAQMLSVDPADRPKMAEVAARLAELVPRQRVLVQRPATESPASPEEPHTPADPPSANGAAELVPPVDVTTARRRVPLRLGQPPERRSQRRLLVAGLVAVLLVASGALVRVLGAPGRSASVTGTAPPAPSASPASARPTSSAGASTSSVPTYTATEFVVPFTTAVPTWVASTPATSSRNLVTWRADDVAVRFLLPVTVYPPGGTRATDPPRDYLSYLRMNEGAGVRVGDVSQRTVDGRPTTMLTATATRPLSGSVGCPAVEMTPEQCHGLRPERRLRVAIVEVDGRNLLVWLRNDRAEEFLEQAEEFDALLDSIRFV